MATYDVVVIGGGISGLSFAFFAARAGRSVLLLEKEPRLGGCLHTEVADEGFWIELGAHTCYNSYGGFIELLEGAGMAGALQPRGPAVLRFIEGNTPLPGKNLGALLRRMNLWQALLSLPRMIGARPQGRSVREHYARMVGAENYARVLGPMLSAVPSQNADEIPAEMLFKKRPRRKDVLRSFTLPQGLGQVATVVGAMAGVTARTGRGARAIERAGAGFVVLTDDGTRESAAIVAVATPPAQAAMLLAGVTPAAADPVGGVAERKVHSVGIVVSKDRVTLPYATFFIPTGDVFHSIVTRDVVPHPTRRGFVFHFKPGLSAEEERARISDVLGVPVGEVELVRERHTVLPSPVVGHHDRMRALDAALAGTRLAVTGNYFAGLAIEDCVQRSRGEWQRVAGGL